MVNAGDIRIALRSIIADTDSVDSAAARICSAVSELLPLTGAAISISGQPDVRGTVCASDSVMARIEELQFTTGVGPCVDAITTGRPVIVPNLDERAESRWPGFAIEAQRAGAQAIFALPLRIGAIRLGAIDLYRDSPGGLTNGALADALTVADAATFAVITMQGHTPAGEFDEEWWDITSFYRADIHQATGMIMAQLGVRAAEALVRLRARAFAEGLGAAALAVKIVAGEIDFSRDREVTDGYAPDVPDTPAE